MKLGETRINAGVVSFALQHRYLDGGAPHTQGVCIQVVGQVGENETELLRFDCFDDNAHYHYGPENRNERIMLDRGKLPTMLERAGYPTIAAALDDDLVADKVHEVESTLKAMAEAASK